VIYHVTSRGLYQTRYLDQTNVMHLLKTMVPYCFGWVEPYIFKRFIHESSEAIALS